MFNIAAQVTNDTMCSEKVSEFNKSVKMEKDSTTTCLTYKRLDRSSIVLKVYADTAFANNDDISSQIGF